MKSFWLALSREGKTKRVEIIESILNAVNQVKESRISPIFPVSDSYYELPDLEKKFSIEFIFLLHPFEALDCILRSPNRGKIAKHLWISHGLASVLYISGDDNEKQTLFDILFSPELKQNVIAIQEWRLDNTILGSTSTILAERTPHEIEIQLDDISSLPSDLQNDILEFTCCMRTLIQRSDVYTPDYTNSFKSMISIMKDIINQLNYLFNPNSRDIPEELLDREVYFSDANNRLIYINELTEEIVQLNSILSYVISQGYSGIAPIEENPCLVNSYSLLGIGTAFKALYNFIRYISNIFSKYPIDKIIENYYTTTESPRCSYINDPYLREWRSKETWNIDFYIRKGIEREKIHDLMVYFSGRQGYSESLFSITIAIQALYLGITNRWNLITCTHEIMHAQVRGILSLLQERKCRLTAKQRLDFYNEPDLYTYYLADWIALNMDRFSIEYQCYKMLEPKDFQKLFSQEPIPIGLTNESSLGKVEINTWDIINEIMTHTLDFYYFYKSDPELYLKQIWLSWACLPTTPLKVDEYVLRSVSAIATLESLSNKSIRIRNAKEKTKDVLKELILLDNSVNSEIFRAALEKLSEENYQFELLLTTCIYLADITKSFIYSEEIQALLSHDPTMKKVDIEEDLEDVNGLNYALEYGKFEGESIINPVSFQVSIVKDILRRYSNKEFKEERFYTLWFYIVCASARIRE